VRPPCRRREHRWRVAAQAALPAEPLQKRQENEPLRSRCLRLAKHRLSNNVGIVNQILSALVRVLRRVRHFALVADVPIPTKARSQSLFRSGTQSDPCISVTTSIMIPSSNSSARRSGTPSQLLGVLLHTTAMFGLSRVRTESFHLLVIPSFAHHPEQLNG
jgi:hypothetical protein